MQKLPLLISLAHLFTSPSWCVRDTSSPGPLVSTLFPYAFTFLRDREPISGHPNSRTQTFVDLESLFSAHVPVIQQVLLYSTILIVPCSLRVDGKRQLVRLFITSVRAQDSQAGQNNMDKQTAGGGALRKSRILFVAILNSPPLPVIGSAMARTKCIQHPPLRQIPSRPRQYAVIRTSRLPTPPLPSPTPMDLQQRVGHCRAP